MKSGLVVTTTGRVFMVCDVLRVGCLVGSGDAYCIVLEKQPQGGTRP